MMGIFSMNDFPPIFAQGIPVVSTDKRSPMKIERCTL